MIQYKNEFIKFVKFNLIGLLNTAVDFIVFNGLTYLAGFNAALVIGGFDIYLAKVISYSCGIANSYFFNSHWTFKNEKKKTPVELLSFILVNLVALGTALGVMNILKYNMGFKSDFWANCIATPVSLIVNYVGNRLFVFKSKPSNQ